LRHLHWLLVLSLIPLAVSVLQTGADADVGKRLDDTIAQLSPDAQMRAVQALLELEDGKGSLDKVFAALPDNKLKGAFLPRHTWAHWLFTLAAAVLFL